MEEQLNKIEKDVEDIKTALLGNEYNDNGLVKRMKATEEYVKKDRKFKWTAAGFLTAIALFKDKIIAWLS